MEDQERVQQELDQANQVSETTIVKLDEVYIDEDFEAIAPEDFEKEQEQLAAVQEEDANAASTHAKATATVIDPQAARTAYLLAGCSLFCTFLFSGLIGGWASLQLLLEEDGVYSSECSGEDDSSCTARNTRFVLIYTIGISTLVVGGAPCGWTIDKKGPLWTAGLASIFCTLGLVTFAISSDDFDLFPLGGMMLGLGGKFVIVTSAAVSFVLPPSRRLAYVTAFNSLFDASSVMTLLLYQVQQQLKISRGVILGIMAGLAFVLNIALGFCWARGPAARFRAMQASEREAKAVRKETERITSEGDQGRVTSESSGGVLEGLSREGSGETANQQATTSKRPTTKVALGASQTGLTGAKSFVQVDSTRHRSVLHPASAWLQSDHHRGNAFANVAHHMIHEGHHHHHERQKKLLASRNPMARAYAKGMKATAWQAGASKTKNRLELALEEEEHLKPPLNGKPLCYQLKTFPFLFACLFLCINRFRAQIMLSNVKGLLEYLGDAETGYTYTQIFVISMPASIVMMPVISMVLKRRGFIAGYALVLFLSLVYNGVSLIDNLPLQLISFAAYTNYRAFLFANHYVFVFYTFGSLTSGRVEGVMSLLGGALGLLLYPLSMITEDYENPYFAIFAFSLAVAAIPCGLMPLFWRYLRTTPGADCHH